MLRSFAPSLSCFLFAALCACTEPTDPGLGPQDMGLCDNCEMRARFGQSCVDRSCESGLRCNRPDRNRYDSLFGQVCLPDACEGAAIGVCEASQDCVIRKCVPRYCRDSLECSGPCWEGRCKAPPSDVLLTGCAFTQKEIFMVDRAWIYSPLIGFDSRGRVISVDPFYEHVDLDSSDPNIATASGGTILGGPRAGNTTITASIIGPALNEPIPCENTLIVYNPGIDRGSGPRFIVIERGDQHPLEGVEIVITGTTTTAMTDSNGIARLPVLSPKSVTFLKSGYRTVSIISPNNGSDDLLVELTPLPPDRPSPKQRATGRIVSRWVRRDLRQAMVGTPLQPSFDDLGLRRIFCDFSSLDLDVPELGLDGSTSLMGGHLLQVGSNRATSVRCPKPIQDDSLGCFSVDASPSLAGKEWSALWTMTTEEGPGALPLGPLLELGAPLCGRGFGATLLYSLASSDKALYGALPAIQPQALADTEQRILSNLPLALPLTVELPALPEFAEGCAPLATMFLGAHLPGRGLVPLGLNMGVPQAPTSCLITPLFDNAPFVEPGLLSMVSAPAPRGLENAPLILVALAHAPEVFDEEAPSFSVLIHSDIAVAETMISPVGPFLQPPQGALNSTTGVLELQPQSSASVHLLRIRQPEGSADWDIYLPETPAPLTELTAIAGAPPLSPGLKAQLLAIRLENGRAGLLDPQHGGLSRRWFFEVTGFAMSTCSDDGPCVLRP